MLKVNQTSFRSVTAIMGAPCPTSSPAFGNLAEITPSAGAVRYSSPKYDSTSISAAFAWLTSAIAVSLSSFLAPFTAMSYCDFAAALVALAALYLACASSYFCALITFCS